jgi:hypothetical protein
VLRRVTRFGPDVRRAAAVRWRSYQTDWRGAIVGYDIPKLRAELNASRDYVVAAAGIGARSLSGVKECGSRARECLLD